MPLIDLALLKNWILDAGRTVVARVRALSNRETLLALAVVLVLVLILGVRCSHAADATVSWSHPTSNTDGTPIATSGSGALTGTRVEWGTCTGTAPNYAFGAASGSVTVAYPLSSTVVTGLVPGTWCFRAFSRNGYGAESASSVVASKVVPAPVPNPPVLSSTVTLAWDLRQGRPYKVVGSIALGTPCGEFVTNYRGYAYYEIPVSVVDLTRTPRSSRVVTRCEVS